MKKRFVSAALAAVMALSMTACGSSNSAAETTAADTEAAEIGRASCRERV